MKTSLVTLATLAIASILPLAAQTASAGQTSAVPMFVVLPEHGSIHHYAQGHAPAALQTWDGSFKYNGVTKKYVMVGTNPAKTNTTTTITIYILPIKMVYGSS
ncbi:MAG TPA: hypothetical protein VMA86_06710, partial [Acetobacteraceae bacterium]|nr:hypothetical protein [Acetobacteraceae bacterium]